MWPSGKLLLTCVLGLGAAYLVIAYLVLPGLWRRFENQPGLSAKPMVTTTPEGIPGDPINVGLVGSRTEVIRAFAAIGWTPADAITLRSSVEIGISVLFDRPYAHAPVSTLLHEGRRQDLAFEKSAARSADETSSRSSVADARARRGGTSGLARRGQFRPRRRLEPQNRAGHAPYCPPISMPSAI